MSPQELKDSILQEAIEGRLVDQRPEEGTGEELYCQIKEEKEKLVKEGKMKREKPLPEVTPEEEPFEIPETWKWVRLGEVGVIQTGATPSRDKPEYYGNFIPFIGPKNIENNSLSHEGQGLSRLGREVGHIAKPESILQVCIGGSIGKCAITDSEVAFNQQINSMKPLEANVRYVFAVLQSLYFRGCIKKNSGGTATPIINQKEWRMLCLPLPPLEEQKRIVKKIEELMPLCDRYEKTYYQLQTLASRFPSDIQKSILQEAIEGRLVEQKPEEGTGEELYCQIKEEKERLVREGKIKRGKPLPEVATEEEPFEIPETWKWVRLGEIIRFQIGKTPPRAESQWWKGDIPWVSIADMPENGHITHTKEHITEAALKEIFKNKVDPAGTLLMSFKLTVGRVSILDTDAVHNEAIIVVYPIFDRTRILQTYLFCLLPTISQWGDSKWAVKGKTLNSASLSNLLIPLPPLEEQKRIANRLNELLALCRQLEGRP